MTLLEGQIIQYSLQAIWWMVSAVTGYYKQVDAYHGFGDKRFTPEENLADAIKTAQRLIHIVREHVESLPKEKR